MSVPALLTASVRRCNEDNESIGLIIDNFVFLFDKRDIFGS